MEWPQLRRALRILRRNREYLQWRALHPFEPFSSFYVDVVSRKLDSASPHLTLGTSHKSRAVFEERARRELVFLREQGLEPHHTCIDYGCGSLRLGRHLIEFLDPGRYVGADVTDRFYGEAARTLDTSLLEEKRPAFHVLSPSGETALSEIRADFIVSTDVLNHVPPRELDDFLEGILRLTGRHAMAFVSFRDSERVTRSSRATWRYPSDLLAASARRLGARAGILSDPDLGSLFGDSCCRFLTLRRQDGAAS